MLPSALLSLHLILASIVPYIAQPRGPYCAAASVLMAGAPLGLSIPLPELLRRVPVHRDGLAWLDLHAALEPLGYGLVVAKVPPDTLHALLAAGLPVVVAVRPGGDAGPKHTWVVTGRTPQGYSVLDPADAGLRTVTPAALQRVWLGGEVVVVLRQGAPKPPGVDWAPLEAQSRRYQAVEWALRAAAVGRPNAQALALLDRALAADASLPELHAARARVLQAMRAAEAPPSAP